MRYIMKIMTSLRAEILREDARLRRLAFPPSSEARQKAAIKSRIWYNTNKERAKSRIKCWQKANPEKMQLYAKKNRARPNKNKVRKLWYSKNKNRINAKRREKSRTAENAARKALKRRAIPDNTNLKDIAAI